MGSLLNHYRPELHYMRGPGPKWHEKHDGRPMLTGQERQPPNWLVAAITAGLLGLVAVVALA